MPLISMQGVLRSWWAVPCVGCVLLVMEYMTYSFQQKEMVLLQPKYRTDTSPPVYNNTDFSRPPTRVNFKTKEKIILHWTKFYNRRHPSINRRDWFEKYCSVKNCLSTLDRRHLHEADAVIFHMFRTDWKKKDIPKERTPFQHYVAILNEPATYDFIPNRLSQLSPDFFNLSMAYRLDSHLPMPYMTTVKQKNPQRINEIVKRVKKYRKGKLVAWFVSHCKTMSDRESYVAELQKYIPVDIYGECGPLNCSTKSAREKYCYRMLERDYKFYLSFENSICQDYVSEKLGKILNCDIVPVTLGGADYAAMAPPHSYINALDFKSPKELANYLKMLSVNKDEYVKYFEWKAQYEVHSLGYGMTKAYCKLCALLNGEVPYESHKDLKSWWLPPDVCIRGNFSH